MFKTNLGRNVIAAAFIVSLSALASAQSINMTSPSNGITTASPLHVVATANGGSYPVSAMRLYIDNQPITTIATASMNTYANVSAGSHYVVVVGWNTTGASFTRTATVQVSSTAAASTAPTTVSAAAPGTVTISSPGSTAGSPIHFVASAAPTS